MATNTTKLVLRKADGADLVNVITDLDNNYDKIDDNPGIRSVTTVAKTSLAGADLWVGRVVYDTDLKAFYYWTGLIWHKVSPESSSKVRTAGSYNLNNTSWSDIDNATWDTVFPASIGDLVEVSFQLAWGGEAVDAYLNVITVVAGVPVSSLTQGATLTGIGGSGGMMGMFGSSGSSRPASSSIKYRLVAGDISATNTVTLRLRYRTGTAANKSIFATAAFPMLVDFANLGA